MNDVTPIIGPRRFGPVKLYLRWNPEPWITGPTGDRNTFWFGVGKMDAKNGARGYQIILWRLHMSVAKAKQTLSSP